MLTGFVEAGGVGQAREEAVPLDEVQSMGLPASSEAGGVGQAREEAVPLDDVHVMDYVGKLGRMAVQPNMENSFLGCINEKFESSTVNRSEHEGSQI